MAPKRINDEVLKQIRALLSELVAFDFTLRHVGRFPLTAYMAPEPAEPFVTLDAETDPSVSRFPAVRRSNALLAHGPIHASCRAIELLENSSGRWESMQVFSLPNGR